MQIGSKIDAYLIRVITGVWIDLVVVNLRSVNDLVAGLSEQKIF
jgi:hypothetical protein